MLAPWPVKARIDERASTALFPRHTTRLTWPKAIDLNAADRAAADAATAGINRRLRYFATVRRAEETGIGQRLSIEVWMGV